MAWAWGQPTPMLDRNGDLREPGTEASDVPLFARWEDPGGGRWDDDGRELDADGDPIVRTPLTDHPDSPAWDDAASRTDSSEETLEAAAWGDIRLTSVLPYPDMLSQVEIRVGGQRCVRDEDVVSVRGTYFYGAHPRS